MTDDTRQGASPSPEAMRELVRDYIGTVHSSYLQHAQHLPPVERASLPLVTKGSAGITVIAAAARRLHLLATADRLPPPQGPEVEYSDECLGVSWTVRFFDPSVMPELGLLGDDEPADVRRVLGVTDYVYHLALADGGGLGEHHARHSGVALANQHARTGRDLERIRRSLPQQARTVDEFAACVRNGFDRAATLLAADLSSGRVALPPGTAASATLEALMEDLRR